MAGLACLVGVESVFTVLLNGQPSLSLWYGGTEGYAILLTASHCRRAETGVGEKAK